jgi:hypothetical protein
VIHTDDLPASQQTPRAGGRYLMTETWQKLAGAWKLRIVHIDAVRTDPPAVALTPEELDQVAGFYRSRDVTTEIRRDGGAVWRRRAGQPDQKLVAETRDVFYVPGQTRLRLIFRRDAKGAVTALVARSENSDRVWERVSGRTGP